MKNLLIAVGIVALVVLGIVLFKNGYTSEEPVDNTRNDSEVIIPAGWERYHNSEFGFAIAYPPEATFQIEASNRVKFTVLGPNNTMGSEITDGFTFTVGTHDKSSNQSLRDFAEEQYEEALVAGSSVQSPTRTTVRNQETYTFQVSTLGTVTYYVIEKDNTTAYTLSYNISDPQDRGYQEMVETMLSSFEITDDSEIPSPSNPDRDNNSPVVSTVQIAVLDLEYEGEPERGCDQVEMVNRNVPNTSQPLTAALEELFSLNQTTVDGYYNFIANTNDTLMFDRATVQNGTAHIYLTGELSGLTGVCDDPRAAIQVEETALQFPTVDSVQLYLNGNQTDLTPSEQGA